MTYTSQIYASFFLLMTRRSTRTTRTDTLFPYPTLLRSVDHRLHSLDRDRDVHLVRGGIMRAGRSFVVRAQPHAPHAFALEIKLAPDEDHQRQFGRNRNAEAKLKHRPPIRSEEHTSELQSLMRI